jgi:hypothetical protein
VPSITGLQRGIELVDPDLRQESEAAEVHAEDRDVAAGLGDSRRHAQQRPIAAHHDDQIDVLWNLVARVRAGNSVAAREAGGFGIEEHVDLALAQPGGQPLEMIRRRPQAAFGNYADTRDANGGRSRR